MEILRENSSASSFGIFIKSEINLSFNPSGVLIACECSNCTLCKTSDVTVIKFYFGVISLQSLNFMNLSNLKHLWGYSSIEIAKTRENVEDFSLRYDVKKVVFMMMGKIEGAFYRVKLSRLKN